MPVSDFVCPFYVNNQEITNLHISACDSDPFEINEDYIGLVLWPHKSHGIKYNLGIKPIRAGQIIVKKESNVLDISGKTSHENLFQVSDLDFDTDVVPT